MKIIDAGDSLLGQKHYRELAAKITAEEFKAPHLIRLFAMGDQRLPKRMPDATIPLFDDEDVAIEMYSWEEPIEDGKQKFIRCHLMVTFKKLGYALTHEYDRDFGHPEQTAEEYLEFTAHSARDNFGGALYLAASSVIICDVEGDKIPRSMAAAMIVMLGEKHKTAKGGS
jgi:hypothetical protein